tara:strand:- start:187 stop:498 length:312 start_codon:yes stop_codon:yes gene_type:complete
MGIVIRTEINPDTEQQVIEQISPKSDTYTFDELYKIIGCSMIELVGLKIDGVEKVMVIDEEGTMGNKEPNKDATAVLWESNPAHKGFTYLLGDVAIVDSNLID